MRTSADADAPTDERYRVFADVEARGMSACYEDWAHGVAEDPDTIALIDQLPPAKRQPNLVFTAARFQGAPIGPYHLFRDWLHAHWVEVRATTLTHATQTNEAARCALHVPALAGIEGAPALLEGGTAPGLCVYPDRYSYRYTGHPQLDPVDGPSTVVLECAASGPVPVPDHLPEVAWRGGVDLNPPGVRHPEPLG